ncbi:MAG: hypothetical protein ACRDL6_02200 [Solirubrobacterales bacterium]
MSQPPKPTELIYRSRPSILPALTALGITALVVGLYSWWPYSVVGGAIALVSLTAWLRTNRDEIARMPRRQRTDTAPIPLSGRE